MPLSTIDAAHLLRRAGFGGTLSEIQAMTTATDRAAAVERLLNVSNAPAVIPPVELSDSNAGNYRQWVAANTWWIERMRTTPAPLQEKMTLFWHGHLVSSLDKVDEPLLMWDQLQMYRTRGLGSFRDLCQAMAITPAMLLYLDNYRNKVGAPNENFARELLELFTLGVNEYTQDDIVAAARAWTGHGLNKDRTAYVFDAARHDNGNKTFFGITKNWDGPAVIDEILNGAKRNVHARFLATKLWSFFAYPNPSPAVVTTLANAYTSANLDITALLRALFNHAEFWGPTARQGLVRTPVEFVVALLKATGIRTADAHPEWWGEDMGQELYWPPNVSGWRPNAYWISSTAMWAKASFVRYVTWKARDAGVLADTNKGTPAQAVQKAFDLFGITAPAALTRQVLEEWVAAERAAKGWAEQPNLITLTGLTPDFQLA